MINLLPQPAAEPTTPAGYTKARTCQVFAWIGQPFTSCDNCGRPIWGHLYLPPYGGARPVLFVRQWNRWNGYHWAPVGQVINAEDRAAWQRQGRL